MSPPRCCQLYPRVPADFAVLLMCFEQIAEFRKFSSARYTNFLSLSLWQNSIDRSIDLATSEKIRSGNIKRKSLRRTNTNSFFAFKSVRGHNLLLQKLRYPGRIFKQPRLISRRYLLRNFHESIIIPTSIIDSVTIDDSYRRVNKRTRERIVEDADTRS